MADVRLDDVRFALVKRAKHLMIDSMAAWIAINMRYVAEKTNSPTSAAEDRLLIGTALRGTAVRRALRAVIRRSYYKGWTTAQIADDLHIADGA